MVKKISQDTFKNEVGTGLAIVDFSAVWCGPCKMLAPVLEEVSDELDGKAAFFNVDVDENQSLAEEYGITNIPALLVLKDGVKQDLIVGFRDKDTLCNDLGKYLA